MTAASAEYIYPDWDAPARVHAISTTRQGGVSQSAYASFNLAMHVGDTSQAVTQNRQHLCTSLDLPHAPGWIQQVHGNVVVEANGLPENTPADASVATESGYVCAVMTADCLPILLCDSQGCAVAAAHAGWRGLAAGIIEATVQRLVQRSGRDAASILAWLGPAIGPQVFEVGDDVREVFMAYNATAADAFVAGRPGHWFMDIYRLARQRLAALGVSAVSGGGYCTYTDNERFFSYRRQATTGRMASLIWLSDDAA